MLIQILRHTPLWVWVLLVGLIVLGALQTKTRVMGLRRLLLIPITMTVFSVYGTASTFGLSAATWGPWLLGCAAMAGLILRVSHARHIHYEPESKRYTVPGSWLPMGVILAIFFTKYATGVQVSLKPGVAQDATFALTMSVLYGVFSGFFVGRAIAVWRRAWKR